MNELLSYDDNTERIFQNVVDAQGNRISVLKICLKNIVYFEKVKNKRRVRLITSQEKYEYYDVMERLAKQLAGYGFAVNCRGNLVNLRHVSSIAGYDLFLDNGEQLAVSQRRVAAFKKQLNQFVDEKMNI